MAGSPMQGGDTPISTAPLSLEELAGRTAEPEDRIQTWRSRGLIGREGEDAFRA